MCALLIATASASLVPNTSPVLISPLNLNVSKAADSYAPHPHLTANFHHLTGCALYLTTRCSFLAPSPPSTKQEEREADAASEEAMEAALLEEEGEVVLVQTEQADGRVDRIVFSSGGEVDVYALEMLCDKVGRESLCRSPLLQGNHVDSYCNESCLVLDQL